MYDYTIAIPIFLLFFILNLETDNKLGNIWYRITDNNIKKFSPNNIISFFILPFNPTYNYLWYPSVWVTNPYIVIFLLMTILIKLDNSFETKLNNEN